ncbi:nucleotidyltransferase domain-containing protein [Massilia pseudoviolaceinigra]|uniref:nucleotidyltransferase domain-containing protein n=1 Tax=Massilia pseudoviolaceinigra TaxID=3057165 RepID=UPI0027966581|nr:nucleotidyltransferase family protein [Massilia sp. CCM 9206]MDQ1921948.1 nucleotidyltransferase family protein [Massilia sp. CCM 9206]
MPTEGQAGRVPASAVPLLLQLLRQPARGATLTLAEWDLLLRQAASARLEASLHGLLDEHGAAGAIPPQARRHLDWAGVHAERHANAVRFEVAQIGAALAATGVPLILLKGGAYAMARLAAARGRLFSDIDILVPKAQLAQVEAALMLHGWTTVAQDAYDQRYYRTWMHELPPMKHARRASVIDVHHAILPETARLRPDPARLRAAAVALAPEGKAVPGQAPVQVLAPADMVLHSAVHLFYDGEFDHGLRDLLDLHRLLMGLGATPGFWETLPARAAELELGRPLFYALRYCARLLHTPVPESALAAARPAGPGAPLLALMDSLFLRALLPNHPSCGDRWSAGARFLLYIRGNWLRMPPILLARHLFHKAFISPRKD